MKVKTRKNKRTKKDKKRKGKRVANKDNAKRAFEDLLVEDDEFLQGYLDLLRSKQNKLKRGE